jgi:hypothetical protein
MLKLVKLPKDNNSRATVMVERPQDPLDYRADDEELHKGYGFPTFLQWPETLHDGGRLRPHNGQGGSGKLGASHN